MGEITMRKMFVFLLSLSLLSIFGCTEKVDIEADKEALNKMSEEWDKNVLTGNFEAIAETYIDNAVRINADGTVLKGKDAISNLFKSLFEQYKFTKCEDKAEDIRVSGDLAVIRGTWAGTLISIDGSETINGSENWVSVLERQSDGSWKTVYDLINNSNE
jgi:uncharacterized protein (TIGR02246 family)